MNRNSTGPLYAGNSIRRRVYGTQCFACPGECDAPRRIGVEGKHREMGVNPAGAQQTFIESDLVVFVGEINHLFSPGHHANVHAGSNAAPSGTTKGARGSPTTWSL